MSDTDQLKRNVRVNLEAGLHMIPCSQISKLARELDCEIQIVKGDQTVDAKNMLDLLTLGAQMGTDLVLQGSGDGANEALDRLVIMFENDFILPPH